MAWIWQPQRKRNVRINGREYAGYASEGASLGLLARNPRLVEEIFRLRNGRSHLCARKLPDEEGHWISESRWEIVVDGRKYCAKFTGIGRPLCDHGDAQFLAMRYLEGLRFRRIAPVRCHLGVFSRKHKSSMLLMDCLDAESSRLSTPGALADRSRWQRLRMNLEYWAYKTMAFFMEYSDVRRNHVAVDAAGRKMSVFDLRCGRMDRFPYYLEDLLVG